MRAVMRRSLRSGLARTASPPCQKNLQGDAETVLQAQYPLVSGLKGVRISVAGGIGQESVSDGDGCRRGESEVRLREW